MKKVYLEYREDKRVERIEFEAKRPITHYFGKNKCVYSGRDYAVTAVRLIKWCDHTGLVVQRKRNDLPSLRPKEFKEEFREPKGFDHTWGFSLEKERKQQNAIILTQPYGDDEKIWRAEHSVFEEYSKIYNLSYKLYKPSEKSLWVPRRNGTWMIFFWNPDYYDFNEELLMGHEPTI